MNNKLLVKKFKEIFGHDQHRLFFAPGRINLIGEHTDYNGGYVFPCAITKGTYALAAKREDTKIKMYSLNFEETGVIEFDIEQLDFNEQHKWANYPKGIFQYLKAAGYGMEYGIDVLYFGNIPNGAGLSSSASIEMVTGVLLEKLFSHSIDRIELVKLGQRVENEFIGVNSGVMDQFAVGMCKKNTAVLLNCETLDYEYAPIELIDHGILIMNTNKRRELAESKYNERRSECEAALEELRKSIDINELCSLSLDQFEQYQDTIKDELIRKRARHAVYENSRTLQAMSALNQGNLTEFGRLMDESHKSLKEDYEVTGKELDTLVAAAQKQAGVLGARMTGAGFGGCAIALVEKKKIPEIIESVGKLYSDEIGYPASFYEVNVGDGAKELIELDEVIL